MSDQLRPILPKAPRKPQKPLKGHRLPLMVRGLGCLIGFISICASIWYFTGFTENDRGLLHLMNAAALSFGVGGLFYIPAFWISWIAHKNLHHGFRPKILPLLLVLPWFPVCWRLYALGSYWGYIASGLGIYAALVTTWMISLRRQR